MKKEHYIANYKEMYLEDKILLVMEGVCYLLAIGTLIMIFFAIDRGLAIGVGILLFSAAGFIGCGLSARSSRDSHIGLFKLGSRLGNKKINKLLKWN